MKRRWTDATNRCEAIITLKDGTKAQCGRKKHNRELLCKQHMNMEWGRKFPKSGLQHP